MGYVFGIFVFIIVLIGCGFIYDKSEKFDLQECKNRYGSSYTLGHSTVNSSIEWCQAPDGTQKTL